MAVECKRFTFSGGMILSGGSDGVIAVSSPNSGMTVRVITDHRGAPITNIDVPVLQVLYCMFCSVCVCVCARFIMVIDRTLSAGNYCSQKGKLKQICEESRNVGQK